MTNYIIHLFFFLVTLIMHDGLCEPYQHVHVCNFNYFGFFKFKGVLNENFVIGFIKGSKFITNGELNFQQNH